MSDAPLRLGVIGLGRAFTLMLPAFTRDPRVRLVAASDPRRDAREMFQREFGAAYESAEALCADAGVEAVYIASPHQRHAAHTALAAAHGRHILVEKPMALSLAEARGMIAAAKTAGVRLTVGHSHSFDAPYLRARELIAGGGFGRVRMIHAANYTDFLYRPRRPEELDAAQGGGVVFSQGAHQVDVVRLLAGARAVSVRAMTGAWDAARPAEGAYTAQVAFEGGAFASLTYSGYGRFDTDALMGWRGELGRARDSSAYGGARAALRASGSADEAALKLRRAYGAAGADAFNSGATGHAHFGLFIVSCEGADLVPGPEGVMIHANERRWLEPVPIREPTRVEVIDELCAAARGEKTLHSGEWGMATLEICLAIRDAARTGGTVALRDQV